MREPRRRGATEGSPLTPAEMGLAGLCAGLITTPLRQAFERVKGVMQVAELAEISDMATIKYEGLHRGGGV